MDDYLDCVVIGAGPYGLSVAAHLLAAHIDLRVFGKPMDTWQSAMPPGMKLKSEGFASSLSAPGGRFTLGSWCAQEGIAYADTGLPVPVEVFIAYGQAFQRQLVPGLEQRDVTSLEVADGGFALRLEDGEALTARRVVLASGIRRFGYVPDELAQLPAALLTHSSAHGDLSRFAGRTVAVVGAGSSATDVAALLHAAGAQPTIVTRRAQVRFQTSLGPRSLWDRIRAPMTGIGPGWKSVLCTEAPLVFHAMPEAFRLDVVRRYLGPAPAWFVREVVEANVPMLTSRRIVAAREEGGRAMLELRQADDASERLAFDHIIAATGYRVNMDRQEFLGPKLRARLRCAGGAPVLDRQFESSIPGLFVVGTAAANSFGPMLRFAFGAGFTAPRLARHLARTARSGGARAVAAMRPVMAEAAR